MIFVRGGTYMMGKDTDNAGHSVAVDDFYIGKYEVNQTEWKTIMGNNNNPSIYQGLRKNKHIFVNNPVEKVSWNDVQLFLNKLNEKTGKNYRLPTEEEWEYAARGGRKSKNTIYAGSNNLDEVAWYLKNSGMCTHSVGQKDPNELDLYDMTGNVAEWTSSWYNKDGSDTPGNMVDNILVLPSNARCVFRGKVGEPMKKTVKLLTGELKNPVGNIKTLVFVWLMMHRSLWVWRFPISIKRLKPLHPIFHHNLISHSQPLTPVAKPCFQFPVLCFFPPVPAVCPVSFLLPGFRLLLGVRTKIVAQVP